MVKIKYASVVHIHWFLLYLLLGLFYYQILEVPTDKRFPVM